MDTVPFAEQVVENMRGGDYDRLRRYHDKTPLAVVEADYASTLEPGRSLVAAPPAERMAWLYFLTMLDHAMATLRHPAHRLPGHVIYWDELQQHQTGAFRPPPATPMEAWLQMVARTRALDTTAHGMMAALVRLMRRHYLVIVLHAEVHAIELPAHPVEAVVIWMAAVDPKLYPLERLPEELRPFIAAIRGS